MKVSIVKFNDGDQPAFYKELKRRVNQYFRENNVSKYANSNMKFKTVFMLCLYFVPLILMLTGVISTAWPAILMWALMGFGMSGIGLSIMHDANHGSYSKKKKVNHALAYLIHFIGGYRENWKIQHNILHHSFTNVDDFDEDLDSGVIRLSPHQERKKMHKFQAFYAPFFYGIMTLYWSTAKDFIQLLRYGKMDLLKGQGLTLKKGVVQLIFNKTWYFALMLVLPLLVIDLHWWQILSGFLLMHVICGWTLAFIFQSAHVLNETEFYVADDNNQLENNWAIHQLKTTANFANKSRFFSWFIGGLNYQIEHHLFPNICHVHYRKISGIVQKTAQDYNLPYLQHKTFFGALKSHFSLLHNLGAGREEQKMAA